jgi:hypothetical protein
MRADVDGGLGEARAKANDVKMYSTRLHGKLFIVRLSMYNNKLDYAVM